MIAPIGRCSRNNCIKLGTYAKLLLTHFKLNGIFHYFQLDQSISIALSNFSFLFKFLYDIFLLTYCGDPDQMPRCAAPGLGLHCLHLSHIKDAMLIIRI